jgi:hypothetical protein
LNVGEPIYILDVEGCVFTRLSERTNKRPWPG